MEGNIVIWVIDDSWKKITTFVKIEIFLMRPMKWKKLLSGIDIMVQIEGINCILGRKRPKSKKKKKKKKEKYKEKGRRRPRTKRMEEEKYIF